MIINGTFNALLKEAQFTKEMLGSGATQIRRANYARKGIYFQSFTSLSTGLERIGKICLMLDYYIDNKGKFPDLQYLKNDIGHNILGIYKNSLAIINKRTISFEFLDNLNEDIHQNILKILSDFAQGDRYANINLLVNGKRINDPIASWYEKVDHIIFQKYISSKKKKQIARNANLFGQLMGEYVSVLHTSETGSEITNVQEGSFRTGMQEAVAPYRQLYTIQIIRFWVELLQGLQFVAMNIGKEDIPFLGELFAPFYNSDLYIKTRKTWDNI